MREKMQQMLERMKTRKGISIQRDGTQRSERNTPSDTAKDEWDMSPQDALQVGIVARYK